MYGPDQLAALSEFARQTILLAGTTLGLEPVVDGEFVNLGRHDVRARCVLLDVQDRPQGSQVQLGVELCLGPNRTPALRSMTAGVGRSVEEAVLQGVQGLIEGGLPPVLAALDGTREAGHWSGLITLSDGFRQVSWDAFEGPLQTGGKDRAALKAYLMLNPVIPLLGSPSAFGERQLTWLKVALFRQDDGTMGGECLLNERRWMEGLEILCDAIAQNVPGVWFFRQFFLISTELL